MPLEPTDVVRAGYYTHIPTGKTYWFCACPGHPHQLAQVRNNRQQYERAQRPTRGGQPKPKEANDAGKTV